MDGARRRHAHVLIIAAAALAIVGCLDGTPTDPPGGTDDGRLLAEELDSLLAGLAMDSALARIAGADVALHIGALAHDSMKGRRTGRPEIEMAAAYVAGRLAAGDVAPGADDYLLRWDLPSHHGAGWVDPRALRPPNVVGLVRGSDAELAGQYVVVTAHYDHVGTGLPDASGDSIFNGADDNASGTAALIEVAEAIAALPTPPRRSVLFLAVSGEELGLLGSAAYMAAPSVSASAMVANVNLDMVSRGPGDISFVVGHALSELGALADAVATRYPELGVTVRSDQVLSQDLITRSDHFHFARSRIPAIGLFTGLHADYHTRDDEADRVNAEKAAGVARLATFMVAAAAMMDEPPAWTPAGTAYMQTYW
ncbi:MAG: M28 family peptidase [Candidatus Longimicrobiales bacterium M2_2A_002]